MSTEFTIACPHCNHKKEYYGDDWIDDLIDTSDGTWITCSSCEEQFYVETEATYKFTAMKESEL